MSNWINGLPFSGSSTDNSAIVSGLVELSTGDVRVFVRYGANLAPCTISLSSQGEYTGWQVLNQAGPGGTITLDNADAPTVSMSTTSNFFGGFATYASDMTSTTYSCNLGTSNSVYTSAPITAFQVSGGNYIYVDAAANVISLDSSNTTMTWKKLYTQPAALEPLAGIADSSGNLYITATFTESTQVKQLLFKTNSSGVTQWARSLASASGNLVKSGKGNVCFDSAGDVYVCNIAVSGTRAFLAKYNTSGTLQWQRYITITTATATGGICGIGDYIYYAFKSNTTVLQVFKYDLTGAVVWKRQFSKASTNLGSAFGISISGSQDGTSLFLGYSFLNSTSYNTGGFIIVAKLPIDGSGTGTYSGITYEASSLTEAAGALTGASPTLTEADPTYYAATSTRTPIYAKLETVS